MSNSFRSYEEIRADWLAKTNEHGAPFKDELNYEGTPIRVCKNEVAVVPEFGCPLIYCRCIYPREGKRE